MIRRTHIAILVALLLGSSFAVASDKTGSGDADALAVVATVDRDEVALAKQAQTKHMSAATTQYAAMMVHDHSANLSETEKLMKAGGGSSAKAAEVRKKDAKTKADLAAMDGAAYEKGYIDAMVKGHTEVLGKLDTELIPGASDPAVKAHLSKTRDAVARHLEKAKALQAQ